MTPDGTDVRPPFARPAAGWFAVHGLPALACLGLALAAWRVFHPGLLNSDGLEQVEQAWRGEFCDWFPPALAVTLHHVFRLGGTLGTVSLWQAFVGALGVYHLARAALGFVFPGRFTEGKRSVAAVAVLLVLFTPFTPLLYFLVHVQNDSWALVALCWATAGWMNLEQGRGRGWAAAAVAGSTAAVLARHNAVVLLPVFAGLAWVALRHRGRAAALLGAVGLIALPLVINAAIPAAYPVIRRHPEDQIMALDLVGVCVDRADSHRVLTYTAAHLRTDGNRFRKGYIPGYVNMFYWYTPAADRITTDDYVGRMTGGVQEYGSRHAELAADYKAAVRRYPWTLALVKLKAFTVHLLTEQAEWWHCTDIPANKLGLALKPRCAPERQLLRTVDDLVARSGVLKFVCTCHLLWVLLTAGAVLVVGRVAWVTGDRRWGVGFLLLAVPAVYYGSHLLAVAAPHYRYMYPATLLVEVWLLALLVGWAAGAVRGLAAGVTSRRG